MSLGAFAVIAARERELGVPVTLQNLAGFGWERPFHGVAMWVFMLGFLGFPLTGGFWGKIYVFAAAYDSGWWWLIVVGVVATMVSAVYYLAVVRAMFLRDSTELQLAPPRRAAARPRATSLLSTASALCLVVTVGSFFAVQPLIDVAQSAANVAAVLAGQPSTLVLRLETTLRQRVAHDGVRLTKSAAEPAASRDVGAQALRLRRRVAARAGRTNARGDARPPGRAKIARHATTAEAASGGRSCIAAAAHGAREHQQQHASAQPSACSAADARRRAARGSAERAQRRHAANGTATEQQVEGERVEPRKSASAARTANRAGKTRRPTGHSFAPRAGRSFYAQRFPTKGADGDTHLARPRGVPARHRPRQAHLRRPVPDRQPDHARGREDARARRRDRRHARPRRPRRRRRRALAALPRRRDRLPGRAEEAGSRRRARTSATRRAQQGRHAGVDGIAFTLTDAHPLVLGDETGQYLGESCGFVITLEDGVPGLLRRRHVRVRRHAADPPSLRAELAVLPIGDHFTMGPREAAVALDMLGSPRCVPCHWGTFPLLDRHAGRARRADERTRSSRIRARRHRRAVRERWFGATGRRVPEIALEGELDLGEALVLDTLDTGRASRRPRVGRPVVVRAATAAEVGGGARPARGRARRSSPTPRSSTST